MQQSTRQATVTGAVPRSGDQRIETMLRNDCLWASGLLLALWLLYAFVVYEVWPNTGDGNVALALVISGGLVLLFNTASIVAMIRHYAADREHIYGLDLHYLDIMRKTTER